MDHKYQKLERAQETNERNMNITIFRSICECGWKSIWVHYGSKADELWMNHAGKETKNER